MLQMCFFNSLHMGEHEPEVSDSKRNIVASMWKIWYIVRGNIIYSFCNEEIWNRAY